MRAGGGGVAPMMAMYRGEAAGGCYRCAGGGVAAAQDDVPGHHVRRCGGCIGGSDGLHGWPRGSCVGMEPLLLPLPGRVGVGGLLGGAVQMGPDLCR